MKIKSALIKGFPGYKVKTNGSVWSKRKPGPGNKKRHKWRRLKGRPCGRYKHLAVSLRKNGKTYGRYIHQLVLEAFVGLRPKGYGIRHFPDRDVTNNNLSNLKYGTYKENAKDRIVHGTQKNGVLFGERNTLTKYSSEIVTHIRLFCKSFGKGSQAKMQRLYRMSRGHVSNIVHNRLRIND